MTFLEIAAIAAGTWVALSVLATVVLGALMHGKKPMDLAEPEDELDVPFRHWWEGDLFDDWPERGGR